MGVIGLRFYFRTTGRGTAHCQRCGGDRPYRRRVGHRWFQILGIPVIPLDRIPEHVQCRTCRTRYRVEVLAIPTTSAMLVALPCGARAAVTTMLQAGDQASLAARSRAIDIVQAAGFADYDDAALSADLASTGESACTGESAGSAGTGDLAGPDGRGLAIAESLATLAIQLTTPAPEWFLADAVRVGLADGPLSDSERDAVRVIAGHLGMSASQADGVIVMTEESAAADLRCGG